MSLPIQICQQPIPIIGMPRPCKTFDEALNATLLAAREIGEKNPAYTDPKIFNQYIKGIRKMLLANRKPIEQALAQGQFVGAMCVKDSFGKVIAGATVYPLPNSNQVFVDMIGIDKNLRGGGTLMNSFMNKIKALALSLNKNEVVIVPADKVLERFFRRVGFIRQEAAFMQYPFHYMLKLAKHL